MSETFSLLIEDVPDCVVERGQAAQHIAETFHLPVEKALGIIDGEKRVVSRGLDKDKAEQYAKIFVDAGIHAKLVADQETKGYRRRPRLRKEDLAKLFASKLETQHSATEIPKPWQALAMGLAMATGYFLTATLLVSAMIWYAVASPVLAQPGLISLTFAYVLPLLLLGTTVLLLLKPVLAPGKKKPTAYTLNSAREPLLFAFVEHVCKQSELPEPSQIRVNCSAEVKVSLLSNWLKPWGQQQILNIGLPVASALTLRQFAGVLANRLSFAKDPYPFPVTLFLLNLKQWFLRLSSPDGWDAKLMHCRDHCHPAQEKLWGALQIVAGLSGTLLKPLSQMGVATLDGYLNQKRDAADKLQAELAGSDAFRNALMKLSSLQGELQDCITDVEKLHGKQMLPDDFPGLLFMRAKRRSAAISPEETTRIQTASASRGVMHGDGVTASLFESFDASCKSATCRLYNEVFSSRVTRSQLTPSARYVDHDPAKPDAYAGLDQYFLGFFDPYTYLKIDDLTETLKVPAKERISLLDKLCAEIRRASPEAKQSLEKLIAKKQFLFEQAGQQKWLELNNKATDPEIIDQLTAKVFGARSEYRDFERPYVERLSHGLAIALGDACLVNPATAKAVEQEIHRLIDVQNALARNQNNLLEIYRYAASGSVAEEYASTHPRYSSQGLSDELERLKTLVAKLRLDLQKLKYPFVQEGNQGFVLEYIDDQLRGMESWNSYCWSVYAMLDALEKLHIQVLNRLTEIAQTAENNHNIKLKLI